MQVLRVHLYKDSSAPFVELLREHQVGYRTLDMPSGVPMASSTVIEIVQAVGDATMWGGLAAVVVAYINSRRGRKVIITTKDKATVQAEGLSIRELEKVLHLAQSLTAFDPKANQPEGPGKPQNPSIE